MPIREAARRAVRRAPWPSSIGAPDGSVAPAWPGPVTIRLARADDQPAIERVAGRDSRPAPSGPLLVAERAGTIEAALSLRTGAVVADPFRRTAELVELLRCHAAGSWSDARRAAPSKARSSQSAHGPRLAGATGCP